MWAKDWVFATRLNTWDSPSESETNVFKNYWHSNINPDIVQCLPTLQPVLRHILILPFKHLQSQQRMFSHSAKWKNLFTAKQGRHRGAGNDEQWLNLSLKMFEDLSGFSHQHRAQEQNGQDESCWCIRTTQFKVTIVTNSVDTLVSADQFNRLWPFHLCTCGH